MIRLGLSWVFVCLPGSVCFYSVRELYNFLSAGSRKLFVFRFAGSCLFVGLPGGVNSQVAGSCALLWLPADPAIHSSRE